MDTKLFEEVERFRRGSKGIVYALRNDLASKANGEKDIRRKKNKMIEKM